MISFYLLAAIAVLLSVCAVLLYRNRAQAEKHKRELQATIVQAMQATVNHRKHLDDDLTVVKEKHRVETRTEQSHLADRADFDNDWGGLPSTGAGYVAPDSGATAANSAGITGD